MLRVGRKVKMSSEALDNYGQKYADQVFTIEAVSTKYMPATEFFSRGRPDGYHPGYDKAANGRPLYDLEGLDFSLYWWEIYPE